MMVLVYLLPTLLGVSVMPQRTMWHDGAYIQVAAIVGGETLKVGGEMANSFQFRSGLTVPPCDLAEVYGNQLL